jgi:hypothetical protein
MKIKLPPEGAAVIEKIKNLSGSDQVFPLCSVENNENYRNDIGQDHSPGL